MASIFLSHSSSDNTQVLRLAEALRSHGHQVWLDEWSLEVGDALVEKIQQGIDSADYLAIWLTRAAVHSGWVAEEWQGKYAQGIAGRKVRVLPLWAEDCVVPTFLAARKMADFRHSFEHGLNELLRALRRSGPASTPAAAGLSTGLPFSVLEAVKAFLLDLEEAEIPFPTLGGLRIVDALKTLPRSGKLIRLETMIPRLRIRSLYDHLLSLGHSADVLLPVVQPKVHDRDLVDLARVIAYHDVCEVVLGDLPQYTRMSPSRRKRARVIAEVRLSQLPNGVPERITNAFIGMFLEDSERDSLEAAQKIMDGNGEVRRFFYALDKLDPIVATWRYLFHQRATPGFAIDEYLDRMRHFFENPRVSVVVEKHVDDRRLAQFVRQLQSPASARAYFTDERWWQEAPLALPMECARSLIEGRELVYVPEPTRRVPRVARREG